MRKELLIICLLLLPYIALGSSYYIDPDNGSDEYDGGAGTFEGSGVGPWKTLGRIYYFRNAFSPGDDIYILCGTTATGEKVRVGHVGTSTDRVVIGAYYMSGGAGTETVGVNGDGKPVIDGEGIYPTGTWDGLAEVTTDYVTIQDLDIQNSLKRGVSFGSGTDYGHVYRCKIDTTQLTGLHFEGGHNDAIVEYCELANNGKTRVDDYLGECSGWPVSGIKLNDCSGATIRYNWVYNQYAESILPGHNSTVMYNLVGDSMSVGIYVVSVHDVEVAYNIVYGTDPTTFNAYTTCTSSQTDWKGLGIAFGHEVGTSYTDVENLKIHHNIVINRNAGIRAYNSHSSATITSVYIYNNTLIDNRRNFWFTDDAGSLDAETEVIIKNNISQAEHADSSHTFSELTAPTNWSADYSQWGQGTDPTTGLLNGANDVVTDPAPSQTMKGNLTDNATTVALLTMANMIPTAGADGNGENLGQDYDDALDTGTDFTTTDPDSNQDPIVISLYDVDNSPAWPIGAIGFSGGPILSNLRPTTQQICGDVGLEVTSSENAYCRYSTNSAHTTYADMTGNQFTSGENSTEHAVTVTPSCDAVTTYYLICVDGDSNESVRRQINVDVAAANNPEGPAPISATGDGISGRGGGSLSIR